jgi:hypothetical protein
MQSAPAAQPAAPESAPALQPTSPESESQPAPEPTARIIPIAPGSSQAVILDRNHAKEGAQAFPFQEFFEREKFPLKDIYSIEAREEGENLVFTVRGGGELFMFTAHQTEAKGLSEILHVNYSNKGTYETCSVLLQVPKASLDSQNVEAVTRTIRRYLEMQEWMTK